MKFIILRQFTSPDSGKTWPVFWSGHEWKLHYNQALTYDSRERAKEDIEVLGELYEGDIYEVEAP